MKNRAVKYGIIIGALVCGITWQKFEDRQKLKNEKAEGKE